MNATRLMTQVAILVILLASVVLADVPRTISYQGRLTDPGGVPLTGVYAMTFRIYDASTLGATLYNSGAVMVTATDGLISVNLGEPPTAVLSVAVFADTNRYLGIQVGADPEMTPRTKLGSAGFAFSVRTIDEATGGQVTGTIDAVNSGGNVRASLIPSTSQISTYGTDDLEQARIWGGSWGELLLFDGDGTNDQTVQLSSQSGFLSDGGLLALNNDDGSPNILLHAGGSGNAAVVVPNNAISDVEILDEPGVASQGASSISLVGTATIAQRTITVPASGYIVAMATGTFDWVHDSGTISQGTVWVTEVSGGSAAGKPQSVSYISTFNSNGVYNIPYAVTGVWSVAAGATTFYLRGNRNSGGGSLFADNNELVLMYFPTAYGTVFPHAPATDPNDIILQKAGSTGEELTGEAFTSRRLAAEVEQLKQQLAEIKAAMGNASQGAAVTND